MTDKLSIATTQPKSAATVAKNINGVDHDSKADDWIDNAKLVFSSCITAALIIVVFAGVSLGWCVLATPPPATFILLIFALILLAYVEALHYACVAVEKWNMEEYKEKYPRAYRCWDLVNTPGKVSHINIISHYIISFHIISYVSHNLLHLLYAYPILLTSGQEVPSW